LTNNKDEMMLKRFKHELDRSLGLSFRHFSMIFAILNTVAAAAIALNDDKISDITLS